MSHLSLSFFRQKPDPLARGTYRSLAKRKLEIVDLGVEYGHKGDYDKAISECSGSVYYSWRVKALIH
jgi:hypothetical protein